jgi:hypothetical protein
MTTDTLLRAAWAAWATWACKRRKPPHVRPTQVGLKGPGGRLPGLFIFPDAPVPCQREIRTVTARPTPWVGGWGANQILLTPTKLSPRATWP